MAVLYAEGRSTSEIGARYGKTGHHVRHVLLRLGVTLRERHAAQGYGFLNVKGKNIRAHRLALILSGVKLPDDLDALHTCDNPPCCNPIHLFIGTDLDNMRDRDAKGRFHPLRGSESGMAKLNEQQVLEIRRIYTPNRGLARKLADRFGVSRDNIYLIVKRRTWKHV
jgi:HNH endonuclease